MSILTLEHISRRFGSGEALADVSLEVVTPQVIGLVGRNGAGKSTLLRLLPPLIHPTAGQVRVLGQDPWQDPEELRQRIGYVADQDAVPAGVRVCDLLDLCAAVYRRWDPALIERFISRLAIDRKALFSRLSRGVQRQVALLMAIGHRPELLLLDEPAGNLDPAIRREVLAVLIELLNDAGTTVLIATHLLSDLERLAERLVILHQGRVVIDGAIESATQGLFRVEITVAGIDLRRLQAHALVLESEPRGERLMLVLECPPASAPALLESIVGAGKGACEVQGLSLEDAFIYRTRTRTGLKAGAGQAGRP